MKPTKNMTWYAPQEKPTRLPLELTKDLEICLWFIGEKSYKIVIAYWVKTTEGYELKFVGARPLEKGVKWKHLEQLIRQGQRMADKRWHKEQRKHNK